MAKSAAMREAPSMDEITAPGRDVEAYLQQFLAARPMPANLREAIAYSLLGDGKRLRPVLAIQSCVAVGGKKLAAMPAAGAIEMIHCFSLIHDDLPAMDDDDLRRGRPTLHRHTSEPMAVLAGDCLQSLAVELLTTKVADPTLAVTLVRELSVATNEMISGQVYDTLPHFDQDMEPIDRLTTTHEHKTGALLRAACRMGAACGGANASQLAAVTRYAEAIGLMFQVVDDLLDVTQTSEEMGKATNKDEEKGKLTYPGLLGVEASQEEVDRLRREAISALHELGPAADALRDLCEFMAVRKK